MTLGLEHGTVKLVPFSSRWEKHYEKEKRVLCAAVGDLLTGIEHIGSTAVPNMQAKPIIDIAAQARNAAAIRKCISKLPKHGYEYKGEYGLPGRHFFVRNKTHHLHLVVKGSRHWKRWLIFRDYLIDNPRIAGEYSRLKRRLAKKFARDRDRYTKAKGGFIVDTVTKARKLGFKSRKPASC